jgi:hypothetical protein
MECQYGTKKNGKLTDKLLYIDPTYMIRVTTCEQMEKIYVHWI